MDTNTQYTFKDFMRECELFEYSKENFDLIKGINELELSERYIENQYFILENGPTATDLGIITESYFMETVSEETLVMLEATAEKQKSGLVKTIINGFKAVLGSIKSFFVRMGQTLKNAWKGGMEKFDSYLAIIIEGKKKNAAAEEYFNEFTKGMREEFEELVKQQNIILDDASVLSKVSVFDWAIGMSKKLGRSIQDKRFMQSLAAAKNAVLPVKTGSTDDDIFMTVEDIDDITDKFHMLASKPCVSTINELNREIKNKSRIRSKIVDFKSENIDKLVKDLETILSQLDKLIESVSQDAAEIDAKLAKKPEKAGEAVTRFVTKGTDTFSSQSFHLLQDSLVSFKSITKGTLTMYQRSYQLITKWRNKALSIAATIADKIKNAQAA